MISVVFDLTFEALSAFKHFCVLDSIACSPGPLAPWVAERCQLPSSAAGFGEAFTKSPAISATASHDRGADLALL